MDPAPSEHARPEPTSPADADLLASYLAARDAHCPACRYNLRGLAGDACPECGRPLRLTLEARERGIPHRLFLLLAFGWVLAAGTMNTVRAVGALREEYRWASRGVIALTPSGGGPRFPIQTVPAAAPVSLFDLSATNWSRAIWSALLVVGAVAGLLAFDREQRDHGTAPTSAAAAAARDRRAARLVAYAWALFAVYASWHAVVFARELLGIR